jgi:hypothetical protein
LRKDTLSHAYELLKVPDEKKRRRLAARVLSGELSLVKLREKIEGRPARARADRADEGELEPLTEEDVVAGRAAEPIPESETEERWDDDRRGRSAAITDDSLVNARHQLAGAVEDLVDVLRSPDLVRSIPEIDRANLAKYLTIAKLKLENAIAMVRSGDAAE